MNNIVLQLKIQFVKLVLIDIGGTVEHNVDGILILRESYNLPDALLSSNKHRQTVQPYGNASMRRCSIFQRLQKTSKPAFHLFFAVAKKAKYSFLELTIVNSDTAAAKLTAIAHQIYQEVPPPAIEEQ